MTRRGLRARRRSTRRARSGARRAGAAVAARADAAGPPQRSRSSGASSTTSPSRTGTSSPTTSSRTRTRSSSSCPSSQTHREAGRRVPRRRARPELHLHRRRSSRAIAFITDIRRGNLHAAPDVQGALRAVGGSRGVPVAAVLAQAPGGPRRRRRPPSSSSTPTSTVDAERARSTTRTSQAIARRCSSSSTASQLTDGRLSRHRVRLSAASTASGPSLAYSQRRSAAAARRAIRRYADLQIATDGTGQNRAYLAHRGQLPRAEDVRGAATCIVPIVGNFAGPKALRAVGAYLTAHGATVTAFYTSNVEQYLFQDGIWAALRPTTSRRCRSTSRARSSGRASTAARRRATRGR